MTHAAHKQQLYTVQEAARLLGWGSNKLFARLRELNIIDDGNAPYPRYVQAGFFKTELKNYWHSELREFMPYVKTLVTVRGISWIDHQINKEQQHANHQDQPLFG